MKPCDMEYPKGMDIRIGIKHAGRELSFDTNTSAADVTAQLQTALAAHGVLTLTDTKGQTYVIPADNVTYLEIGTTQSRPVGFVS